MRLFEPLLTLLITIVISPLHLLLSLAIKKAGKAAALVQHGGPILERRDATAGVPTCVHIPPDLEQDFITHRSPTYLKPMVRGTARELSRMILRTNAPRLPSDEELAAICLGSSAAWRVNRDEEGDFWLLDLTPMTRHRFFEPNVAEILRFEFEPARGHYVIHDQQGRAHRPGDPTWIGARRKLVGQLTLHVPAGMHSWVHFWLPDVVSACHWTSLPRDTHLYRLLAPHTRFTCRINMQALWVQKSSDNRPSGAKRLTPWLSFPFYKDDFRDAVVADVGLHYDNHETWGFPADLDRRIPYFDFLVAYYEEVRGFVERLAPHLEADVYARWAEEVDGFFPGFAKASMVDALSRFIWQVGVVHIADHASYANWSREVGFVSGAPTIDDLVTRTVAPYDRYRFLCFLETFVVFNKATTGLDQRMTAVDAYGFPAGSEARLEALRFADRLRALDHELKSSGRAVLELDELVQSVCF